MLELTGLQVPSSEHAGSPEQYSAVQLFVQRARQVRADFCLTPDNAAAVVRVCRLVEGLPLGIELAAAWVRALDCPSIADEIERNLDFLASAQRDIPERQRSIRAVFEHSWALLEPAEKLAFRRLSVFRGGVDLEAAAQVAEASPNSLAGLVDKSFLRRGPAGRYDIHEVMRQYGEARRRPKQPCGKASFSTVIWPSHRGQRCV